MIRLKPLILSLLISLGMGNLAGFLTRNAMQTYQSLVQPIYAPPSTIFPTVWAILYFLMGISAYLIYVSKSAEKKRVLGLYAAQLVVNFIWPLIFFLAQQYLLAFICLVILWLLVFEMIRNFYKIDKMAALLQIPYILWLTFAGYLNLSIYLLNR
ncbi:TspO/MBR family protein [Oscillospiraceae bacterium LTW-04]|nr:TspO/MBR family protein [Oscillospiraceae bacterium MB24-C1]